MLRKTIAFLFLLAFSLQTFSYGVLLTRYQNHYDCQQKEEKTCHHEKDASSCCDGNCALAKEIKKENAQEGNNSLLKISKIPEPAETHHDLSILQLNSRIITTTPPALPPVFLRDGAITGIFHPPLI